MLNMQNVKDIEITEGKVRTIHDKDNRLIWGRLSYDTKYVGDTYQQTYSGKNLMPYPYANGDSKTVRGITYTVNADGTVILNGQNDGTASAAYFFIDRYGSMPLFELSAGTYYFIPNTDGIEYEAYDGTNYYGFNANNNFSVTFPTNVSIRQLYVLVRKTNQTQFNNYKIYPMLTTSASPTVADFEPYTGSIPAPNPDYPQNIQTVTGEQTVTISDGVDSQSYPISLGSIELCKIGDYQDYIYKSGDDWYVHKEVDKYVFGGDESWQTTPYGTNSWILSNVIYFNFVSSKIQIMSNLATGIAHADRNTTTPNVMYSGQNNVFNYRNTSFTTLSALQTATKDSYVYYAIASPTDTKITDATLIGQLNAVHEWLTRYGYNATVTGNLPIIINQTNL